MRKFLCRLLALRVCDGGQESTLAQVSHWLNICFKSRSVSVISVIGLRLCFIIYLSV